jgi:hypothetical protein
VIVRQAYDRITGLTLQMPDGKGDDWIDLVVLEERELATLCTGKRGRSPHDGSARPVFIIPLPKPVETLGLRLWVSSVVQMKRGTVSVYEFEAYAEPPANVRK